MKNITDWIEIFIENNITAEGLTITIIGGIIYGLIVWQLIKDDSDQDFDIMG